MPVEAGGGWQVHLFVGNTETDGGAYLPSTDPEDRDFEAYWSAYDAAEAWRRGHTEARAEPASPATKPPPDSAKAKQQAEYNDRVFAMMRPYFVLGQLRRKAKSMDIDVSDIRPAGEPHRRRTR